MDLPFSMCAALQNNKDNWAAAWTTALADSSLGGFVPHLRNLQPVGEGVVVANGRPASAQPVALRQQRAEVLLHLHRQVLHCQRQVAVQQRKVYFHLYSTRWCGTGRWHTIAARVLLGMVNTHQTGSPAQSHGPVLSQQVVLYASAVTASGVVCKCCCSRDMAWLYHLTTPWPMSRDAKRTLM
jgi:hypothetical protein